MAKKKTKTIVEKPVSSRKLITNWHDLPKHVQASLHACAATIATLDPMQTDELEKSVH